MHNIIIIWTVKHSTHSNTNTWKSRRHQQASLVLVAPSLFDVAKYFVLVVVQLQLQVSYKTAWHGTNYYQKLYGTRFIYKRRVYVHVDIRGMEMIFHVIHIYAKIIAYKCICRTISCHDDGKKALEKLYCVDCKCLIFFVL